MMQVGRAQGMIALNDALGDLVKKGLITADEAMSRSVDKGGMSALLKRGQPGAAA
jgi:Tfp pilus assembly pilus retraction ATPase PilT